MPGYTTFMYLSVCTLKQHNWVIRICDSGCSPTNFYIAWKTAWQFLKDSNTKQAWLHLIAFRNSSKICFIYWQNWSKAFSPSLGLANHSYSCAGFTASFRWWCHCLCCINEKIEVFFYFSVITDTVLHSGGCTGITEGAEWIGSLVQKLGSKRRAFSLALLVA